MYKKLICLACLALLAGMANDAVANEYDEGPDPNNSDHLWMTASNWTQGLPGYNNTDGSQWATMSTDGTLCLILPGDDDASARGVNIGSYGAENTLDMSGGNLTCQFFDVGRGGNGAAYGDTSFGHFIMSGGQVTMQWFNVPNQWDAPPFVQGDVLMTDGVVNAENLTIGKNAGVGHFDFHGGTIHCSNSFVINPESEPTVAISGTMDITEGVLTSDNNLVDQIQGFIDAGWITFYGVAPLDVRYYVLDYDITNPGQTTLAAVDPGNIIFENAWGPIPKNGALIDITDGNVMLAWNSGDPAGLYKHEVYFGTNPTPGFDVQLNESDTDHIVVADQLDTTYYWKITEAEGANTYEGPVWKFTTADFLTVDDFNTGDLSDWTETGSVVASLFNDDTSMRISTGPGQSGSVFRAPPQSDWDQQGLKAIRLSFLGDPNSSAGPELSLTVNNTTVVYDNTEGLLQTEEWTQWFVSYDTLTNLGADLNNVTKVEITITGGSTGFRLGIDDIELALLQCLENPLGDASGDCLVNMFDVSALSNEWMVSGYELP